MNKGPHQDMPTETPPASGTRSVGVRRPSWRTVLSVLAGGGLTAASLGGPLANGALGAEGATGPTSTDGSPPPTSTTPAGSGETAKEVPWEPSTTSTTTTTPQPSSTPSTTTPATPPPGATGATGGEGPTVVVHRKQHTSPSKQVAGAVPQTKTTTTTTNGKVNAATQPASSGANASSNVALPPQLVAGQAGALAALLGGSNAASVQALNFYRIPLFLLPIYRAAAIQYGVPWPILAAINEIETDYGTDLSVSSAGAEGWMQFEPSTWLQYGVDALNAGYADPYNPVDAIYAAARYLKAAGAASNLSGAILAYNHSEAYVSSVLLRAKLIAAYPDQVIATLTGLIDGRPPVTGKRIGWGAPALAPGVAALPSSSSATAGATATSASAPTPHPGAATAASSAASATSSFATPGSTTPPSPGSAATPASATSKGISLVDVRGELNAHAVAVQDGRIVKLGYSRKLGRYVVLRDVYGDVFTYAGLGAIAHTYKLPKSDSVAGAPAQSQSASGSSASTASDGSAGGSTAASKPSGKMRVFARTQRNPDAQAAVASARILGTSTAGGRMRLGVGSVVAEGTILGQVSAPAGANDGHLRFAIQPAGDTSTIDPRAILSNWTQLDAALHPRGAKASPSLLGATASDVFLLSKGQLEREVLSDPGVALSGCSRHEVASGAIDKRALAMLAFLSRSGLKPTVGTLRCGAYDAAGYIVPGHSGDAVAIVAINGVPIAGHQGAGSITDTTIRTLLTLRGSFTPARIVSLMRYPGAPSTLARADHGDYLEIAFNPAPHSAALKPSATAAVAGPAGSAQTAPAPVAVAGALSVAQWEQLIGRIAALPSPTVAVKPSSGAIPDKSGGQSQTTATGSGSSSAGSGSSAGG
ncbi:MAG TPA: lytic murein transglycosylase [Solirubrobacteraceae bacterium]